MSTQTSADQHQQPTDVELAAQLATLLEQKERVDARIADVKAQLVERHPEKGDYKAGDFTIRVTVVNTLDAKKIAAEFPAETFGDNFYKRAVDTERFKAFMLVAGKDLADFQKQSAPSVKVL
jgi:hypothetical protein